jgi:hypothetical protein
MNRLDIEPFEDGEFEQWTPTRLQLKTPEDVAYYRLRWRAIGDAWPEPGCEQTDAEWRYQKLRRIGLYLMVHGVRNQAFDALQMAAETDCIQEETLA